MTGKVLYITGEYPPMVGGVADYTQRLASAVEAFDWTPLILTSSAVERDTDSRIIGTVDTWGRGLQQSVRKLIDEAGVDIIHIQYQTGAFDMRPSINLLPVGLGIRSRPVKVVTTYHDLLAPYLFPKAGRLRVWANRLLALGSDAIVLTNERDLRIVSRFRPVRSRTLRIPIGSNIPKVTTPTRKAVLERIDIDPEKFVIGFFGFITPDKGIEDLLDALERPGLENVELLVLSGDLATTDRTNGRFREGIIKRLNSSSVGVTITGYLPEQEIAESLAAVDLIALPYRSGASLRSGTLIASVQSGSPVVTTDPRTGDSLAPLSPGESIWLVPACEPEFLHNAVKLLRGEPGLRHRLAQNALSASDVFAWPAIGQQHADLYNRILNR